MARNSNSGWSRPWAAFFALVILLGGVAVSLGFGVRLRGALERNADQRITTASANVQVTVGNELARYADSVRLAAAAMTALPEPTRTGFDQVTAAVARQELTAVQAVTFVVPATPDTVGQVGPVWRARGARGLRPQAIMGVPQHLFTVFSRGLGGAKAPPVGVDQGAAQAEVDVARLARTGKDVAVSDAYVRLADAALPQPGRQLSFDVVAPVYNGERTVVGFVVLNVIGNAFVSTTLFRAAGDLLDAQLLTRSGDGSLAEVAAVVQQGGGGSEFRRTQNFEAGQRQWTLRTSAGYRTLLPNAGRTDMVVVVAGSALAVMFGTLMYLQMSATKRADEEVALEVAEQLAEYEENEGTQRLRRSLVAQEALVDELLAPAATAHADEVDLGALVAGIAGHAEGAAEITVAELPVVRADAALLRLVVDALLADALHRTPADALPRITVGTDPAAPPGRVRLVVDAAGTVAGCTLTTVPQMASNPS